MRSFSWLAAVCAAAAVVALPGCGDRYRPVITPVPPTPPAPQPTAYAVVISQPGLTTPANAFTPCPATTYSTNAVATIIDFSGDSIIAQAVIGNGPITSAISSAGGAVYVPNCDGTITTIPVSATLQSNQLQVTTLFAVPSGTPPAVQSNLLVRNPDPYFVDQNRNSIAATTLASSGIISLVQEINVAPAVLTITGASGVTGTSATSSGQRVYSISQGSTGSGLQWGACATPASVTVAGEADAIETSTNSISARLPLGICPTYGISSLDGLRTYVLNRGNATSPGSVTVINTQTNAVDTKLNATGTIPLPVAAGASTAGPVYAAFYPQTQILVTANYDSGTVSFINTPLDVYGNDAAGFGQVLATVKVGSGPSAITILGDGSRAYVANQNDGTVSVINMTSYTVESTIPVGNHPRAISSTYNYPIGKVYVTAPDSQSLTVIRTDTDVVSALIPLQGNGVDVHTTTTFAGSTTGVTQNTPAQTVVNSDSPGSGVP